MHAVSNVSQPAGPPPIDGLQLTQDMLTIVAIRQYFTNLRQERGHKPDASPMDLELLLIVKFIVASDGNPIDLLRRVGLILLDDRLAINGSMLTDHMVSSRSRINNTLNRLKWDVVDMKNEDKWNMLKPLLDRTDVRNWTVRLIPPETALFSYIRDNPHVKFRTEAALLFASDLHPISLDPGECK
jgi:hypothetical protein